MPYIMANLRRELIAAHRDEFLEEFLKITPREELLKSIALEERLKSFPVEERIKGSSPEERQKPLEILKSQEGKGEN